MTVGLTSVSANVEPGKGSRYGGGLLDFIETCVGISGSGERHEGQLISLQGMENLWHFPEWTHLLLLLLELLLLFVDEFVWYSDRRRRSLLHFVVGSSLFGNFDSVGRKREINLMRCE